MMNFTNDEMNLMCIYSAGSSRTGLMQKLTEMKKYLESDEVQLLELTEGALAKLATMTDESSGSWSSTPISISDSIPKKDADAPISEYSLIPISDFCGKPQNSEIGWF